MSRRTLALGSANDLAAIELRDTIDGLFFAANELSIANASDPLVPQLGSLAEQVAQVLEVLEARK